jgi:hypothetical protein
MVADVVATQQHVRGRAVIRRADDWIIDRVTAAYNRLWDETGLTVGCVQITLIISCAAMAHFGWVSMLVALGGAGIVCSINHSLQLSSLRLFNTYAYRFRKTRFRDILTFMFVGFLLMDLTKSWMLIVADFGWVVSIYLDVVTVRERRPPDWRVRFGISKMALSGNA